jgi:hypothetical protein
MLKQILSTAVILLAVGCAPTRVVVPLEKGQTQVGASLGKPQVNDGSLPVLGVYAARGLSESTTAYGGLHLSSALLGTVQLDGGVVKAISEPSADGIGFSYNYGGNLFVSTRDGAARIYPDAGINAFYKAGPHIFYTGANTWVDPTFFLTRYGKGSPVAPSVAAGYRIRYKWLEAQVEYKLLNPIEDVMIPQASIPGIAGRGGRGWYYGLAFNF